MYFIKKNYPKDILINNSNEVIKDDLIQEKA
jgi:hypothetical protein